MTDLAKVKKIYKLNVAGGNGGGRGAKGAKMGGEDERKELEVLVLGSIALRGSTN
jgi:EKC/KEOPS complex subunit CGI121/TPRKB